MPTASPRVPCIRPLCIPDHAPGGQKRGRRALRGPAGEWVAELYCSELGIASDST